jgi:hypothetical protein
MLGLAIYNRTVAIGVGEHSASCYEILARRFARYWLSRFILNEHADRRLLGRVCQAHECENRHPASSL